MIRRLALTLSMAAAIFAAPDIAWAAGKQGQNPGVLLAGPACLLLALAPVAVLAILMAFARRIDALAGIVLNARDRLDRSWGLPLAWGIAATILALAAAAVLAHIPLLGLLAAACFIAWTLLVGLGTIAAGLMIGDRLLAASGEYDRPPLSHLRAGLTAMAVAAIFPVLGWITVLVAVFAGIGAVLEGLVRKGA